MNPNTISIERLSKSYLVGHQSTRRERYTALRDVVGRAGRSILRKGFDLLRGRQILQGGDVEEFWALKDISIEISQGEVLGVIGRNGAGKSTLLKVLSRITEPTSGKVTLRGRVASLLEVGTGFHPELSGRENIFLNGAILGMRRAEITRKFDEIVDFAGIERFLDTPVKRYSSGMYVRLAFAVAAHLDPEILIVDEVLAVGDAEFQQKCLGKMGQVSRDGRTVILVSHDMRKLLELCHRGVLLNAGQVECDSTMSEVVEKYTSLQNRRTTKVDLSSSSDRTGSGEARVIAVELTTDSVSRNNFLTGDSMTIVTKIDVRKAIGKLLIAFTVKTSDGLPIYCFQNDDSHWDFDADLGISCISLTIDSIMLYPGAYNIDIWIGDRNGYRVDMVADQVAFTVEQDIHLKVTRRLQRENGVVFKHAKWNCLNVE